MRDADTPAANRAAGPDDASQLLQCGNGIRKMLQDLMRVHDVP
jgi:hypothetical protein